MAGKLPAGPYKVVVLDDGSQAPWYIIPFDKEGRCTGPHTRSHLIETARGGAFTDIYLFSHGWNNDWEAACTRYDDFIQQFQKMRRGMHLAVGRPYRPLLLGVFWPSTALVMPWERGPRFAAGGTERLADAAVGDEQQDLREIADLLPPSQVERFYELAYRPAELSMEDARALAEILAPVYAGIQDPEEPAGDPPTPDDLLRFWASAFASSDTGDTGGEHGFADDTGGGPAAAGLGALDPRGPVRTLTVLMMKDRAGTVGCHGVHDVLRELLEVAPGARAHLIGHSYGAKVVLSALCCGDLPRKVNSVLLLQPAVNAWCFAADVAGEGFPGGYRKALESVELPILSTYSRHDEPLTKLFHLAVRRRSDLGEVKIAGSAPSRYAALGGFGPQGCSAEECVDIDIMPAGEPYPLGSGVPKLFGVRGDRAISGHGDVVNEATAWALYTQVVGNA